MRSIRYILLSYFQKHVIELSIIFISIGLFIIGNIKTFETQNVILYHQQDAWNIFLAALCFISGIIGLHLRININSSNSSMLPNFRRRQMMAAGIILFVFLLWPTIITNYYGFPIFTSLAMMLFSVMLMVWLFFSGKILLILLFFPLWVACFELLGLQTGTRWFSWLPDLSGFTSNWIFPVSIIIISVISLLTFTIYYFRVSTNNLPRFRFEEYPFEEAMNYDIQPRKQGRFSKYYHRISYNSLLKLVQKNKEFGGSVYSESRLIQYGLFGPNFIINIVWIAAPILWMLFFSYVNYYMEPIHPGIILPIWFYIYLTGIINLVSNFFRSTAILPELQIKSGLGSRKKFAKSVIISYLKMGFRYWLLISISLLITPFIIPDVTYIMLPQLFVFGLIVFIFEIALSVLIPHRSSGILIISHVIVSASFLLMIIPMRVDLSFLFDNSTSLWIILGWSSLISLIFFYTAYTRWIHKELNFEK